MSKGVFTKDTKPKDFFEEKGWPTGEQFAELTIEKILNFNEYNVFFYDSCLYKRDVDIPNLQQCFQKIFSELNTEDFEKNKYSQNAVLIGTALTASKLELTADNIVKLLEQYVYIPSSIEDLLKLKTY